MPYTLGPGLGTPLAAGHLLTVGAIMLPATVSVWGLVASLSATLTLGGPGLPLDPGASPQPGHTLGAFMSSLAFTKASLSCWAGSQRDLPGCLSEPQFPPVLKLTIEPLLHGTQGNDAFPGAKGGRHLRGSVNRSWAQ